MIEQFTAWAGIEPTEWVMQNLREAWTLHPLKIGDEVRAIACMSGSEIHFAVAPQWRHRLIQRRRTREFLAPLMARFGFLTTRAEPDEKHHDFLTRIGFERTYNDGRFDHYMMSELPFAEGN